MSDNPYATPETMTVTPERRAIWTKELKSGRVILIIVGIIQLLLGTLSLVNFKSDLEEQKKAEVAKMPGYYFDQQSFDAGFEEQKVLLYGLGSIPVLIGIYFFIMAALIFKFPVGVTLSSLIVFVITNAVTAYFDPTSIAKGIILKVIFLAILWKAFQSARTAKSALLA
ncbi:MAG TPA: hypothetical protein VHM91_23265 [Verrucomicrobiales bacterium]|nr:hypothetical protein [Verrucomicrobiales bacterium]